MGASRTSNKDILNAIETGNAALTASIDALVATLVGQQQERLAEREAAPVVTEPAASTEVAENVPAKLSVKPAYLTHMKAKAQDHATNRGEDVVLYGRVNLHGEHKLAYCLKSRWSGLKDNGLIGAVEVFHAE